MTMNWILKVSLCCVSAPYCGRSIRIEPTALFLLYLQTGMYTGPSAPSLLRYLAERAAIATIVSTFHPFRNLCQRRLLTSLLLCLALAKREAFLLARVQHYSNEAEAMKRAQQLMADEEEEAEASPGSMELDGDAGEEAPDTGRSKVPPVPPLPGNVNGVGK